MQPYGEERGHVECLPAEVRRFPSCSHHIGSSMPGYVNQALLSCHNEASSLFGSHSRSKQVFARLAGVPLVIAISDSSGGGNLVRGIKLSHLPVGARNDGGRSTPMNSEQLQNMDVKYEDST